jgi:hypothetical protein
VTGALLAGGERRPAAGGDRGAVAKTGAPSAQRPLSPPPERGWVPLEERLTAVWEQASAGATAECPVCRGRMRTSGGAARCDDCGSTLT